MTAVMPTDPRWPPADVKTPKNLAVGPHAVGIRVRVAGGAVVNTDQVTIQVRK